MFEIKEDASLAYVKVNAIFLFLHDDIHSGEKSATLNS